MIEESFIDGVPHGRYAAFHRSGTLLSEGKLVRGSREGEFKVFDEDGNHIKSLWFRNNTLITKLEIA
jgi:antitoxin component YwqK of YwqJK toxin-antitoxin module